MRKKSASFGKRLKIHKKDYPILESVLLEFTMCYVNRFIHMLRLLFNFQVKMILFWPANG